MRSVVENTEGRKCGVWRMRSVENAGCRKCGVWKMRSVKNAEYGGKKARKTLVIFLILILTYLLDLFLFVPGGT